MATHDCPRVSGFGWTLLPLAPFRLERLPGRPRAVLATRHYPAGRRQAAICLDGDRPAVELERDTASLGEVLSLFEGPHWDHWRVETGGLTARWPEAFVLTSGPGDRPP